MRGNVNQRQEAVRNWSGPQRDERDRGPITAQRNHHLGLVGHERHLIDQQPEDLCCLGLTIIALRALIEYRDPLAADLRHIRMQERRLRLSVRQQLGQFYFAGFKTTNLSFSLAPGTRICRFRVWSDLKCVFC